MFLQRLWKTIQAKAKSAKAPALVYQEAELPLRIVRDLFAGDFERALIDHERTYKRIVGYLKKTSPHMLERVHRYKEKTPLFEGTGVDAEIRSTLNRRVDLPSGGYLVFDYAEAFTVIDVNTGRFVGSRSKTSHGAARGHDHEEQPRGGQGGRAPAAPARHRRDHRHRLHRHGEPEESRHGRGGAAHGARARPHEDLRRRDLAARARRDDAPERHRRPARDPHEEVPDLRGRRDRHLGGVRRNGGGAPAADARRRLARAGVPGRGEPEDGVAARRSGRVAPDRDRGGDEEALLPRPEGGRPSRPRGRAGRGQARGASPRGSCRGGQAGRGQARRARPPRRQRRGREARRPRRRRRRRREARRQEGEGADRARAGRCRLRLARRQAARAARSRSPSRARPRSRRARRSRAKKAETDEAEEPEVEVEAEAAPEVGEVQVRGGGRGAGAGRGAGGRARGRA